MESRLKLLDFGDDVRKELENRAIRLNRKGPPFSMDSLTHSVLFLRGAFSRAVMCLPAFYYYFGAKCADEEKRTSEDGPFLIAQAYSKFSDLNTLTLNCRKVFDHDPKGLTGGNFAKSSDSDLRKHAEYWSEISSKNVDEAQMALIFLRALFKECTSTNSQLLQKPTLLHKRIGLLKQHADRAAAHLSLDDYALNLRDLAHVTAALVIVGEIIKCFDDPTKSETYFSNIDKLSLGAAIRIFPDMSSKQLFGSAMIEQYARDCWTGNHVSGLEEIMDKLPEIGRAHV